jgi:hypothetical protein
MGMKEEEPFIHFFAAFLQCKKSEYCERIWLPVASVRADDWENLETERTETYPPDWPGDGRGIVFGCSTCGFLSEYRRGNLQLDLVRKRDPGLYRVGEDCFCIEFQCGQKNCGIPAKLYIQKPGATEHEVARLLSANFFVGQLPCGHTVACSPKEKPRISRVLDVIE